MAEYLVNDTDMIKVADAIRAKGKTTEPLSFPEGYINNINQIAGDSVDLQALETSVLAQSGLLAIVPEPVHENMAITGGINADGVAWSEPEISVAVDKPYVNKLGYTLTLAENTEENHGQPQQIYEHIYRSLYLNGEHSESIVVQDKNGDPIAIPAIAIKTDMFSGITSSNYYDSKLNGSDTLMHIYFRVVYDNPQLCNGLTAWSIKVNENNQVTSILIPEYSDHELSAMKDICNRTKAEIQELVYNYTGTLPKSVLTPVQKSRVAKVIHDFLVLNNKYDEVNEGEKIDQTMYPALSKGLNDPVCASYALAFNWLCEDYGIETLYATGVVWSGIISDGVPKASDGHAWNLVNFEDSPGDFSSDSSKWSIIDCTFDDPTGKLDDYISWKHFCARAADLPQPYVKNSRTKNNLAFIYPADTESCADYKYTGSTPYEWEVG